jgi:hypothetical protein
MQSLIPLDSSEERKLQNRRLRNERKAQIGKAVHAKKITNIENESSEENALFEM